MIKDEKSFDKYMIILEKVIIKKINSELIYNKLYLKAEKRFNAKDGFECFYIPAVFFDLVYINYGNYYSKVFLKNLFITFFEKI